MLVVVATDTLFSEREDQLFAVVGKLVDLMCVSIDHPDMLFWVIRVDFDRMRQAKQLCPLRPFLNNFAATIHHENEVAVCAGLISLGGAVAALCGRGHLDFSREINSIGAFRVDAEDTLTSSLVKRLKPVLDDVIWAAFVHT